MKKIFGLLFVASVTSATAAVTVDFTGDFAVSNWTQAPAGTGSINTTNAPTSVTLESNNDGSGVASSTLFSIVAPYDGTIAFAWAYQTFDIDGPNFDPFIFTVGGVQQDGSNSIGNFQGGSFSGPVFAGQLIAFNAFTTDSALGPAVTTISSFTYSPTSVIPEPGATLPLAALLGFGFLYRSRRNIR